MPSLITILAASEPSSPSAPSNYQVSCRVEIAFNAGQRTPASLYTWTDVSDYVELAEGITITWGRQDERSQADANQLSLTLDNSDGRFTAGKTTGPYGSAVKLDRPIRVILDPVDGGEVEYFRGFVNEWPTEWDATDAYAKAPITASSRLSRLGYTAALKSIIEQVILADSPSAYYTLGEPEGATQANDSSGSRMAPLLAGRGETSPVVFGSATGPGTDDLTAAQFVFGGQWLLGGNGVASAYSGVTFELFRSIDNDNIGFARGLASASDIVGGLSFMVDSSGILQGYALTANDVAIAMASGGASLWDGSIHHLGLAWDGSNLRLYRDGSLVSTVAAVGTPRLGEIFIAGAGGVGAHVAVYGSALSSTQIAAHAAAGLTGFAGETTDARLKRYAAFAGIPTAEINAETGSTTVQHIDTTGKQVVELMRAMETTEGGVLHDGRDGTLMFHNRAHRYVVASAYTLNMAEQEVEAGYTPKYDRTGLLNDITAQDVSGKYSAHRTDATSVADYGQMTASIETTSDDDDAPLMAASWALFKYKDPKERVPSLTVNALAQVGKTPNCSAILATTIGTKITVSNRPTQAASSSVDYFVEGGTTVIGPESLFVTFNLSPTSPEDQTLVIGDPVRGFIGTNPIAF